MDANNQSLRIYALGTLRVESSVARMHPDGARCRKPRDLLLALIAAGPGGASQSLLCEALWPDSEGDAAYRALITTVFRLRRWIGSLESIRYSAGRLLLSSEHCWVDAWEFEQNVCTKGCQCMPAETLALYQGPLLGDAEAPLVIDARERLRRKFVRSVLHAVDQFDKAGDAPAAIELCERAVEADSISEELHRALIALLGRHGQGSAASGAYKRCRAALLRNFGTKPSEATERALREACTVQVASPSPYFTLATSSSAALGAHRECGLHLTIGMPTGVSLLSG